MKVFLTSLVLALIWGGATFVVLTQPDLLPPSLNQPLGEAVTLVNEKLQRVVHLIEAFGLSLDYSNGKQVAFTAFSLFVVFWVVLGIVFGARGFFRDFSAFLPLNK